jgi:deazaflavin-dependent oxidoreductase (nitroreductase family)
MATTLRLRPTAPAGRAGARPRVPALLRDRRAPLSRLLFRLPVALYRVGLGWLLGHQFLLLAHAGRRTGRVRLTALKVLRYDPATGECVVASAWGPTADWYRNIRARPAVAVRTGHACYVPEQRWLPQAEAFAVFDDWARRQRWFARLMLGQLGLSWEVPEAERRALVARFPFVGFRPRVDRDPAGARSLSDPGDAGPTASEPRGRPDGGDERRGGGDGGQGDRG